MLLNKKRFERASPPCSYLSVLSLIRLSCQEPHEDSPLHAREKKNKSRKYNPSISLT